MMTGRLQANIAAMKMYAKLGYKPDPTSHLKLTLLAT